MIYFLLSHSTSNPLANSVSSTLKTNLAPDHFLPGPLLSPGPCHHLLSQGYNIYSLSGLPVTAPHTPLQRDFFKHKSDHISVALKPCIGFLGLQLRTPPSLEHDHPLPPSLTSSWILSHLSLISNYTALLYI